MEDHKLDKYVEYILAQVGEGRHTKEDIKMDLHDRGLSDAEIKEVLDAAWKIGSEAENEIRKYSFKSLILKIFFYICMCIILYLMGHSIIKSFSFGVVICGFIVLIRLLFHKKKFQ